METLPIKPNHHLQSIYKNNPYHLESRNHYQIAKEKIKNPSFKDDIFDHGNDHISYEVDFYGFIKKGIHFDIYV